MKKSLLLMMISACVFVACAHSGSNNAKSVVALARNPAGEISYQYWPYHLEGCMNTKDIFLDKTSKQPVSFDKRNGKKCHVIRGLWFDYFTQKPINNPSNLIVTTVIPLEHAKNKTWSIRKTLAFTHDLDQLIVIEKNSEGEQKYLENLGGLKTLPENNLYYTCQLGNIWLDTKDIWSLSTENDDPKLIAKINTECARPDFYNRSTFPHWSTQPNSKCDSRFEAMKRDADARAKITTKRDNPSCKSDSQRGCNPCVITGGLWNDPYSNTVITEGGKIDVDHFVPLGNAFVSGGWRWPLQKRERYANYLIDPSHLLSVSATENRKKGARHPGQYLPPNDSYQCEYIENWLSIKLRWGLALSYNESTAIKERMNKFCPLLKENYAPIVDMLMDPMLQEINNPNE